MNEIVVGTDGSEHGLNAVEWAAEEAGRRGAPLRILHAAAPWSADVPMDPRIRLHGEEIVEEALARARSRSPGVKATGGQVDGPPAKMLIKESAQAGMVVVGSRGAGGLAGLLLGSVALQVVSHAACPAVAVRPVKAPAGGAPGGGIVVGVDGSPGSAAALGFAFEEAALRRVPLRVLLAWSHPASEGPGDIQPLVYDPAVVTQEEERALAEFASGWSGEFPDVPLVRQVVHAKPARALAGASAGADLLVVGSRGRGGFTGLVLGSVGHAMIHHARCPVAVIPHARR